MIRPSFSRASALAFALTLAAGLVASPSLAEPELKTEDDKTIYVLGTSLGNSLKGFLLSEEELAIVILGIEDEVAGRKPRFAEAAARDRVQALYAKRSARAAESERIESADFVEAQAKLDGAVQTSSGLVITELIPGTGKSPTAIDVVKVHYHGMLRDGTVFDSSVDRGEPAEFPLNKVIPCWTEGVGRMKVGGKSRLVCPSDIAYGDNGRPPTIPGGAALVFEVELIEVK